MLVGDSTTIAEDMGIVVEDELVTQVDKFRESKASVTGARVLDLDGIVCPSLINAHTHLELSAFKEVIHKDFVDWILHLVALRSSRLGEDMTAECAGAKREAENSGTGYFVNVGNDFRLNQSLGKNQHFQFEQIGINDAAAENIFQKASSLLFSASNIDAALGIHAPYSTSPSLMKKIKSFNNGNGKITSIHLAETADEIEFIRFGKGRMVDLLNSRMGAGNWTIPPEIILKMGSGQTPVSYADSLGILDRKTMCVHCVFVEDGDLDILRNRGCKVVVCVRSNRNLGGVVPNVRKFKEQGIGLLLGTDSRASSQDLNMFAEMSAFYGEFHDSFGPSDVFRMASSDPADFLGLSGLYGRIAAGKSGTAVYVPYSGKVEGAFEFLVSEAAGKTRAVDL